MSGRSRRARSVVLGCALLAFAPFSARALDPEKSIYQFNVRNWTRQNGLPADKINTIAQTTDGYLWFGTLHGIVRFDGANFELIPAEFPGARGREIRKLWASPGRPLRVAISHGGYASFDGETFMPIESERWPAPRITGKTIFEARDGTVWTGSNLGLGRWIDGKPEATLLDETAARVFALAEDSDGRLWIGTEERGLFYSEDGKIEKIADPTMEKLTVNVLAVDRENTIWVGTNRELRRYDREGQRLPLPRAVGAVSSLCVDGHGKVWIGTNLTGLLRFDGDAFASLRKEDGLGSDHVTSVFEDAEGSLWVGTRDGVSQLTDLRFPTFTSREGIVEGEAHTVSTSRDGGLWITTSLGFSHFDGKTAKNYGPPLTSEVYVKLGHEGRSGKLYLADSNKQISVVAGEKLLARFQAPDWPEALAEHTDGSLLVAVGPELYRVQDGKFARYRFKDPQPDFGYFDSLHVADDGTIWTASYHGVFRIRGDTHQQWTTTEGLPSERVHYVFQDVDGTAWAGTLSGLGRIKGDTLKVITTHDGLYDDQIFGIVADDHGYLWFDSGRGIFRVARKNLNDFAEGKIDRISADVFSGADSVKFADRVDQEYSIARTADGRIWIPNSRGVVMIDPARFYKNTVVPPVLIQEVRVNDVALRDRQATAALKVGDNRVEFFFAALTYVSPQKTRIRYRLEGFDQTWIEAGARRSVLYRLDPGHYTFHLEAANADGVWNTAGDRFTFQVPPRFYQTGWFAALCAAAVGLGLFGAYRHSKRRQARLQAENDVLEAKVGERTAQLAYERDLLRTLLDTSPDKIYFKDRDSRVVMAGRAFAVQLKFESAEALIGKTDFDLFSPDHAHATQEDEEEIIRTGRPLLDKVEKEITRDGRVAWSLTTKMPWRDKDGQIIGTFGISKDITKLKESEAKLLDLHKQLLETSRQAGMAEVATGVLHNVGNVLNSVNVSATLVVDRVRASKVSFVPKVSGLLEEHTADLAAFLTSDPKGQKIPAYLATLGKQLLAEQDQVVEELGHLRKNVEHIKEIVALQQSFAKVSGIAETVVLSELVDDAVRMNSGALERHQVQLVREYEAPLCITVERHKVIQILINLIRNAKYACDDSGRTDKRIVLRTERTESGVRIAVIDNGIGIPRENLTRIFAHGFTTRKEGHGFGLHSGALAAKELGGRLNVVSEGTGHGAAFTLDLPLTPPKAANGSAQPFAPEPAKARQNGHAAAGEPLQMSPSHSHRRAAVPVSHE